MASSRLAVVVRRFNLKSVCQLQGAYRVQKVRSFAAQCRRVQDVSALKSIMSTVYSDLPRLKSGVRIPFPAPFFLLIFLNSPSQGRATIIGQCTSNHPPFGCFDLDFILLMPPLSDPDLGKSCSHSQLQETKERGMEFAPLARIMHRFLSRRGESAGLSALRHARGHPLAGRPPQTYCRVR